MITDYSEISVFIIHTLGILNIVPGQKLRNLLLFLSPSFLWVIINTSCMAFYDVNCCILHLKSSQEKLSREFSLPVWHWNIVLASRGRSVSEDLRFKDNTEYSALVVASRES